MGLYSALVGTFAVIKISSLVLARDDVLRALCIIGGVYVIYLSGVIGVVFAENIFLMISSIGR